MRTISFLFQAAILLLAFFHYQTCNTTASECGFSKITLISDIAKNSSRFDQQCVTVTGKVTDKLSTAVLKLYYLKDTTGHEIMINVPLEDPLPAIGDELIVGGRLVELVNISEVMQAKSLSETQRATIERRDVTMQDELKELIKDNRSDLHY